MTEVAESADTLDVVSFAAGGFRFAVQAHQVRSMFAEGRPETGSVAFEDLIGLPSGPPTQRKWLTVGGKGTCIEVGEPVALESWPVSHLFPLPWPVAARISLAGIKGLAMMPSGVILIVDLEAFSP